MTYKTIFRIQGIVMCAECGREKLGIVMCAECGRQFDLLDESEADEWYSGHDCE